MYRTAINFLLGSLDSLRVIGPNFIYSENYYSKRKKDPWRTDAENISRAIRQYFAPDCVIDFGCAIGAHLELFYENGINIKGIEGNSDAFDHAVVPEEYLEQHDLRDRYDTEKEYDLVLCFELAEHLPERYADTLVDTLADAGKTIVMTAATPGQGGTHHVNEQPREYWYKKFESRGFEYDPDAVENLRDMIEVDRSTWVYENLMVFVDAGSDPS
ncbi:hypothetical protein GCM10027355_05740 [Haloplanus salinarum]